MNIYKLTFDNGQVYVGQTKNKLKYRLHQHFSMLEAGTHKNGKMMQAYKTCNLPKSELLETCEDVLANSREIYWISYYNSFMCGLNQTPGGDNNSYTGEESHNAKYTEDDYMAIYSFLAHTDLTFREIAKELNVSYAVVQSINYEKAHQYLAELMPIEASLIRKKHGNRNAKKAGTYPNLKSPTGEIYSVDNCSEFASTHGLNSSNLITVLSGKRKSHLGWTLADPLLRGRLGKSEIAKVVGPDSKIYSVYSAHSFADEHGLNKTAFARLLTGNFKTHKGWTLHE